MRLLSCSLVMSMTLVVTTSTFAGQPLIPHFSDEELTLYEVEQQNYYRWSESFLNELTYHDGAITLPGGKIQLQVPDGFYYLSPEDSEKVLVDAWGNPPSSELPLGMLFPVEYNPLDDRAWGMTIYYTDEGHVKDKDAEKIDYDDLLSEMRKDTDAASEYRQEQGYESIKLVGWAAEPYYDSVGKKLHWAQEYQFGGQDESTLNYKIRALGREGVLELNVIASLSELPEVNASLDEILQIPSFTAGNTYAEFNPSMDKVAAYGIGGLIAGKVLAKTGLLAGLLLFFKKFFVIGLVAIGGFFKLLFGRKKDS